MKLPDITNEEPYVQDWLTKEEGSDEIAKQYGWTGKNLGAHVRRSRKVPAIAIKSKEELLELVQLVPGPITLSHWLMLSPAKTMALVFSYVAPDDLLKELYVDKGMSYKQIVEHIDNKLITVSNVSTKIKRLGLIHKEGDKEKIRMEGIQDYLNDKDRVELNNSRRKETMKERYGVDSGSPFSVKEFSDKARQSVIRNHGGSAEEANKAMHEKSKKAVKELYGVDNIKQAKEGKLKALHFTSTPYVKSVEQAFDMLSHDVDGHQESLYNLLNKVKDKTDVDYFTRQDVADIVGVDYRTIVDNPNYFVPADGDLIRQVRRETQLRIENMIKGYGFTVEREYKPEWLNGQEFDIYVPDKNFAIEYNGYFWHSTDGARAVKNVSKTFHKEKTDLARNNEVNLMHIWDYDWENPAKRLILESQIKYHLGVIENKYYARKLVIKAVEAKEERAFLNNNHIQGYVTSSEKYGLYDGDELVSLMTFGKRRFDNNDGWELLRFATKLDASVAGGASRLLKHFARNHPGDTLISYANNDFAYSGDKSLYANLGFSYVRTTEPGYKWVSGSRAKIKTVSRQSVQPWKLKKYTLEGGKEPFERASRDYSDSDTEKAYMLRNGFYRVYDAGNDVYELQV